MINLLAFMGPIGGPEMMVIFIIVLLLFGAKKIPELARGLGKSMGEFKRARDEFEDEIRTAELEVKAEKTQTAKKSEPKEETSEVS
jgi:TatA/E family protein of Tat protein translocase